ncbi:type II CAAX prenyl endopeptidase Rce1 family protein [Nocardioides sp. GCM10027113]|uniref:CPBP family glutamic-type intramembrane protease n=1 Tax=unclassified Nocardioides TaxID=2615069 RepID=UPI003608858A
MSGHQPPPYGGAQPPTWGGSPPPYGAGWPPPGVPQAPMPAREPAPPLEYHRILLAGRRGWWRPVLGMLVLGFGWYLVAPFVVLGPFVAWQVWSGEELGTGLTGLVDTRNPSPATLAFLLVTLSTAIPICWFIIRVIHGLKPRWLSSVRPRLRWRFLLICFAVSFATLFMSLLLGALLPGEAVGGEIAEPNPWSSTLRDFVLVVVFLTPLQAAAEEYAFRGYLAQAFGGLLNSRVAAVVGPALLFALAHGIGQSLPIFFDRFAFGLVAGVLVLATGGLEAAIAMHVLNNWLAFGLAVAFFDLGDALNPTGGSWWDILVTVFKSVTYLALALWVARSMGLDRRTSPAVLEASRGRV